MAQSIALSSVGTATMVVNPLAKSTTLVLTPATAASTGAVDIQISVADPSQPSGPTATFAVISSGAAMLSSNVGTGLVYTVLSPISQVRINSSANNTTWTLQALQSVSA